MKYLTLFSIALLFPFILFSQDYTEIKVSELPKGVSEYLTTNMPGGTIVRAAKGVENGQDLYAAVIEIRGDNRIMIFDKEGNFVRRTKDLTSPAEPPQTKTSTTTTTTTQSNLTLIAPKPIEPASLPENIQKFLKNNHKNGKVLEAKLLTLGETPIFQIIYRDATTDNVYHFDARGEYMKKRTYILKNSPFKYQYPLSTKPTQTNEESSEETPQK